MQANGQFYGNYYRKRTDIRHRKKTNWGHKQENKTSFIQIQK